MTYFEAKPPKTNYDGQDPPKRDVGLPTELIHHVFGTRAEVEDYNFAKQQYDYTVLTARLSHPSLRITVKLAGSQASMPCPFSRTGAVLNMVRARTSVPVAEVLAVDDSYNVWPWRYIITGYIPGEEWAAVCTSLTDKERVRAHRQIGEVVAQLHSISLPGFGELYDMGEVGVGISYPAALEKRAKRRIAKTQHAGMFIQVLQDHSVLFRDIGAASLCHEDLHRHNILFDHDAAEGWNLSGVLDFDSAWAGHHESDLSRLELWRGMAGDGFWEAYNSTRHVNDLYPQRRLIHQLMWCLEYASSSASHLADTNRICAALGLGPIDSFS